MSDAHLCTGFNWAKSDDVIEGALQEMRLHELKGVYMATDSMEDQVRFRFSLPIVPGIAYLPLMNT